MVEISENRKKRFSEVASHRQLDLTVLLENVHDPHNIGAVMRSCDSVGIDEIYILYTDPKLIGRGFKPSHGTSTGINNWVDVHYFTELESCVQKIKTKYKRLVGTLIDHTCKSLYDTDLASSLAIAFGNEKDGISKELAEKLDDNLVIPQVGFAQSLNISVACAVTLYEAFRQRKILGKYNAQQSDHISSRFVHLHESKKLRKGNKRSLF